MAKIDLKSMSLKELKTLQKRIDQEMIGRDKRQRKEALIAIRETAKQLGYSLGELVGDGSAGGVAGRTHTPAPPKYRSKDDPSLTWSGRGRPPRWIKEAQENGIDLDTLLIEDND